MFHLSGFSWLRGASFMGPRRPHKHKDPTLWCQDLKQGDSRKADSTGLDTSDFSTTARQVHLYHVTVPELTIFKDSGPQNHTLNGFWGSGSSGAWSLWANGCSVDLVSPPSIPR